MRDFILVACAATLLGAVAGFAVAAPSRPNIVVVLCDDLGYGDLGCYGSPVIETPHLDRFAREGVRFTACYAAAPNCSPARTGMLTGRTPSRAGMYDVVKGRQSPNLCLRESEITVAELLRDAGYDTFHVGKWHLTSAAKEAVPAEARRHGFAQSGGSGMRAVAAMESLIAWLGGRAEKSRPFFAYVALHEPHEPVLPKSDPDVRAEYDTPDAEAAAKRVTYGRVARPAKAKWENRTAYYACVSHVDEAFGRLMEHLDEAGLREETFVWFTSDNGPEHRAPYSFGSPGPLRGAKGHVWEGGIRVPGIVRWPGHASPGTTCDEPIHGTDLLPTACALAGVKAPRDRALDGVDFLPVFEGRGLARPIPLYWSMWAGRGGPQYALRDGDWKLLAFTEPYLGDRPVIEHIKKGRFDKFEIYNLRDDLGEHRELSARCPERFEQMTRRFLELHGQIMAEGPDWDLDEHQGKARAAWPAHYATKRRAEKPKRRAEKR